MFEQQSVEQQKISEAASREIFYFDLENRWHGGMWGVGSLRYATSKLTCVKGR